MENIPSRDTLIKYIGDAIFPLDELIKFIDINYGFEALWNYSEKHDKYELKYRRGGKTLITFYIEKATLTALVVFGKAERENFEKSQNEFSTEIIQLFNNTHQYHDGKWLWIPLSDNRNLEDIKRLIIIKRKPKILDESKKMTMCGYRCDLCKAYAPNIKKKDERVELSMAWKKYYGLSIQPDDIYCEGCRNMNKNAKRIDMGCIVRTCVMEKGVEHCGNCEEFLCEKFNERRGLSYERAKEEQGPNFDEEEYDKYLKAYDNETRLKEYKKTK